MRNPGAGGAVRLGVVDGVLLSPPERHWECPSCGLQDVTREARPHSRMHQCKRLAGLSAPMVEVPAGREGLRRGEAEHVRVERGDWVGSELVRTDGDGRPWMAVRTRRQDGEDCAVFAPTAKAGVL